MAKINLRSPYYVNVTATNLTSARLELHVYTGTRNTDRTASIYTMETASVGTLVVFEIAELARDYLDSVFSGSYFSQNVWVDYRITQFISNVAQTPSAYTSLEGFDGYGYFEEGKNPQGCLTLLQDNADVYRLAGKPYYFPIRTSTLTQIDFYFSNGTSSTEIPAVNTAESTDITRYISIVDSAGIDAQFQNGELYLFQDSVQMAYTNAGIIYMDLHFGLDIQRVNIYTIEECKYEPYKLTFVNKCGALQDLWFFKASYQTTNTKEEYYKANILTNGDYQTYHHQKRVINKGGNEKIALNSGYYPENFNEIFKQLMFSEKVWILKEGLTLPVNITTNEVRFKTSVNDKLINYAIDVEFAFDKINSVR
jgi:hypothetical protein